MSANLFTSNRLDINGIRALQWHHSNVHFCCGLLWQLVHGTRGAALRGRTQNYDLWPRSGARVLLLQLLLAIPTTYIDQ